LEKLLNDFLRSVRSKENFNTLVYLGASVFSAFAGFIMLRYFTKYLGPEDIGIFGYVSAVNAFLIPILTLNLQTFYLKEVYRNSSGGNKKEILGTVVIFTLIWTTLLTILLTFVGSITFQILKIKFPFFPYMFLTLLSNFGLASSSYIFFQYRVLSKPWSYFWVTVIQTILLIGFGYFFVGFIHWGIYGRILGVFIGTTLFGILCFFLLNTHMVWRINTKILKKGFRFALPLVPYSIATLLYDLLDRFFLERYSANLASTGIYNMGSQYALVLSMLSLAFYQAYEPVIFRLVAEKDDKTVNRSVIMLNNFMLIAALPLILCAGWLIGYLTNGKFLASAYIGGLLVVAFYFRSSYIMLNTVLSAMSRTREIMWFSLMGLLFVIIMSIYLVPTYNNAGTAIIKILLYVIMFLSSYLIIRKSRAYLLYIIHTIFTGSVLVALVIILKKISYL
jgi:O-antigen/teichoic acid export membrane protein